MDKYSKRFSISYADAEVFEILKKSGRIHTLQDYLDMDQGEKERLLERYARQSRVLPCSSPAPPDPVTSRRDRSRSRVRSPLRIPPSPVMSDHSDHPSPASQDLDIEDGFQTVQPKKGKKRTAPSSPPSAPPLKATCSTTGSAPPSATTDLPHPTQAPSPTVKPPPPIFVRDKDKWEAVTSIAQELGVVITAAKNCEAGIKVSVPTPSAHRELTRRLRESNIGFHTYALEEEKVLRVIIRGVPKEVSIDLVRNDLVSQKFPVIETHRLIKRDRTPFDLILVVLPKTKEARDIFNLKMLCGLSGIGVETPHRKGAPSQCHRCQSYGHAARFCTATPRCVKCIGNHATSNCTRQKGDPTPPSCVLCGAEGHTANYRGCPKAPKGYTNPLLKKPQTSRKPIASQNPGGFKLSVVAARPEAPRFVAAPLPTVNAWQARSAAAEPAAVTPAVVVAPTPTPAPTQPKAKPSAKPAAPSTPSKMYDTAANATAVSDLMRRMQHINQDRLNEFGYKLRSTNDPLEKFRLYFEYTDIVDALKSHS